MEPKRTRTEGQRAFRCVDETGTVFVALGGCVVAQGSKPQVSTSGCFVALCPADGQGVWAVSSTGAVLRVVKRPGKDGCLNVLPITTVPQAVGSSLVTVCCWWAPARGGSLVLGTADGTVVSTSVETGSSEPVDVGALGEPVRWAGASKSGRLAVLAGRRVTLLGTAREAAAHLDFESSTAGTGGPVVALSWCGEVLVALCLGAAEDNHAHPCVVAMRDGGVDGRRFFPVVESIRGDVLSQLGGMAAASTWILEGAGDQVKVVSPRAGAFIEAHVVQPPGLEGAFWRVVSVNR